MDWMTSLAFTSYIKDFMQFYEAIIAFLINWSKEVRAYRFDLDKEWRTDRVGHSNRRGTHCFPSLHYPLCVPIAFLVRFFAFKKKEKNFKN